MIGLVLVAAAMAAPTEVDRAVVAGEDIAEWRALTDATLGPPDHAARLRAFITDHPESPLAEAAWAALVALDLPDEAWRREHRATVARLERARLANEARAEEGPAKGDVAELQPAPDENEPAPPWTVHLHVGGALDGLGPAASAGFRVERGSWAGLARIQVGQGVLGELDLRLAPPVFGVGFLELGLDTRPRGVARLGIATVITGRLELESSLGVAVGRDGVQPAVRLDLAWLAATAARAPE